ncbi:MAG TPA: hypothetical protein VK780_03960 [Thermoanaerobaculia bacterium]|jgi:hypothetical protein|nr:hypothetical protein [Thermoanaerobaculia bacterium]
MRRIATVTLWGFLAGFLALPALAAESRGFELSLLVDGSLVSEYPWQGRTYVEALRSRSFTLRVSNPTGERVAVAISVDGRNVVDAKRTGERAATKWVLDPWQTLDIPGWQVSGDTARRFFFTETARSYAKWLGDTSNVGTIEAVFFRGRHRIPPIALESPRDKEWEGQAQGRAGIEGGAPQNSAGARDEAARERSTNEPTSDARKAPRPAPPAAGSIRPDRSEESDGYAATGIGERTSNPVQWVRFEEDTTPAARIALRYEFRRELVRLGVLSRGGDDLSNREHATGFSREYAPDPNRPRSQ